MVVVVVVVVVDLTSAATWQMVINKSEA